MSPNKKTKVAFLDRDGTINVEIEDREYVYTLEDWEWEEGAIEALKKLRDAGFVLAIVTNQSGIGHGFYTEQDMQKLHEFMVSELKKHDVSFAHIAYCKDKRDSGCECRKPNIGMAKEIEKVVGPIDYENSWMFGNNIKDMQFGKNIGAHTALIPCFQWDVDDLEEQPDIIAGSLAEAVDVITGK